MEESNVENQPKDPFILSEQEWQQIAEACPPEAEWAIFSTVGKEGEVRDRRVPFSKPELNAITEARNALFGLMMDFPQNAVTFQQKLIQLDGFLLASDRADAHLDIRDGTTLSVGLINSLSTPLPLNATIKGNENPVVTGSINIRKVVGLPRKLLKLNNLVKNKQGSLN